MLTGGSLVGALVLTTAQSDKTPLITYNIKHLKLTFYLNMGIM